MAFEDLLRSLTSRAENEIEALLASAREQAATVRRDADHRCAERSATALREQGRVVGEETERAVADAVRTQRHGELAARARARDRVFAAARERLKAAAGESAYRTTVPDRFAAAVAVIGDEPAEVRCSPDLAATLGRLAQGREHLQVVSDPTLAGGFTIRSRDGRVEVDEVLEHRLTADADFLGPVALRGLEPSP